MFRLLALLFVPTVVALVPPLTGQDFGVDSDGLRVEVRGELFSMTPLLAEASTTTMRLRAGSTAAPLAMRALTFDPLESAPSSHWPQNLRARPEGRLFLLQYRSPEVGAYRDELESVGAEVLDYFPHRARLIRVEPSSLGALRELPFVRWIGPYHPGWRVPNSLRPLAEPSSAVGEPGEAVETWTLMTTRQGTDEKGRLLEAAEALGFSLHRPLAARGRLLVVRGKRSALNELLHHDLLFFAEPWGPAEADVDLARALIGADSLEMVEGYAGLGVRAQVRDFGMDLAHPEFQARPPLIHVGNTGNLGHGSAVYGILFSPGSLDPMGRGILPEAQGVFQAESLTVDRHAETADLLTDPYRCVFETNSTGSPLTPDYTAISADMDAILFDLDFLVFQSQSNSGTQDSRPEAWAKNIVSVGGVVHGDTASPLDDFWGGVASIGPAADGRIKPDLCSFVDQVFAPSPFIGYLQGFGGTSAATPIVAGAGGLMFEMWADGVFGNPLVNWDVFDNRPTMTLAKALLINSAAPYSFSGTAADLTRTHQGWGQPDVQRLHDDRASMQFVNEDLVLTPLASHQRSVLVSPGTADLRVTMVFADPPGNPASAVHRINDLSLRVTAPDGTLYHGNVGLLAGNVSTPGGSPDAIDTVERVVVLNPASGVWTIEVSADEINVDGHVETPALDADFSLAVSGVQPAAAPPADSGQANQLGASMQVVDSVNLNGRRPELGEAGPFFVSKAPGENLEMCFEGPPHTAFLLLLGPLNRGNFPVAGAGQLDIGLLGPQLGDLSVVINGAYPASFFDLLGRTGPDGTQRLSLTMPPLPPGILGTLQGVFFDPGVPAVAFTAATEVSLP